MSGAIPPLPQYAFMAWCSVKAQGQLYLSLSLSLSTHDVQYLRKRAAGAEVGWKYFEVVSRARV
jgi:hypothetical protein